MTSAKIQSALAEISSEVVPTIKRLKLASLVTALFREQGIELVVVEESAIEFYTEGAYASGDIDLCILSAAEPVTVRLRQELMGKIGAKGGPRSWKVAGATVNVLGEFENAALTRVRSLAAPYGKLRLAPVEELIVERILVSKFPQEYAPAADCAKKIVASVLCGEIKADWQEVKRLAQTPAYGNWPDVKQLTDQQAKVFGKRSPVAASK